MQYFVVMIDYGRRGREAIVDPEITRRGVIARVASEILAEAALPELAATGADLQASRFDHARDLRKHEVV